MTANCIIEHLVLYNQISKPRDCVYCFGLCYNTDQVSQQKTLKSHLKTVKTEEITASLKIADA